MPSLIASLSRLLRRAVPQTVRRKPLTILAALVLAGGMAWAGSVAHAAVQASRALQLPRTQIVDAADAAVAAAGADRYDPYGTQPEADTGPTESADSPALAPAGGEPSMLPAGSSAPATSQPRPSSAPSSVGVAGTGGVVPAGWLGDTSAATGIPRRALRAYASAAITTEAANPACHLGWNTIAAIGYIESKHGTHGGNTVRPDGTVSGRILGPALDGNGFAAIPDTDAGALDGDTKWDRAVGPFQFIPSTWRSYGVRAAGDGASPDPHNMDDAALSAARYLCAAGGDLATPAGWTRAVLAYNHSNAYARSVLAAANAYAERSGY